MYRDTAQGSYHIFLNLRIMRPKPKLKNAAMWSNGTQKNAMKHIDDQFQDINTILLHLQSS
jgi:hypothetical protein